MNRFQRKTSNKFLAQYGRIIEEDHKLPKRVLTGKIAKRGVGYTSVSHAETSKTRRLMAKASRRINRLRSQKKFRPTGSKQRV